MSATSNEVGTTLAIDEAVASIQGLVGLRGKLVELPARATPNNPATLIAKPAIAHRTISDRRERDMILRQSLG
jgi:hypothetical protein